MSSDDISINKVQIQSPNSGRAQTINGPRDEHGTPAFTMQITPESSEPTARELARSTENQFDESKSKLVQLIQRINKGEISKKSLYSIQLKYSTPNVPANYSGPIAVIIPEVHLYGGSMQNDKGGAYFGNDNIDKLFKTNLELMRGLIDSGLSKHFVHEGAMKASNPNSYFDEQAAHENGILVSAIAGIEGVTVSPGEKPETQLKALASMVLQFNLSKTMKQAGFNPEEISIKSIEAGIQNMLFTMNNILQQVSGLSKDAATSQIVKYLNEKIAEFSLSNYVSVNQDKISNFDPQALQVNNDILKLGQAKLTILTNWIFQEGGPLASFSRDKEIQETVSHQGHGLVSLIAGLHHIPNLVINEFEENQIPVIVLGTDFQLPNTTMRKDVFDFDKPQFRANTQRIQTSARDQAVMLRQQFLS